MKSKHFGNEGAFACAADGPDNWYHQAGLTKREYFAALIMQALIQYQDLDWQQTAKQAITGADALIDALEDKE